MRNIFFVLSLPLTTFGAGIYDFAISETNGSRIANISWQSDIDGGYVVEEADFPAGPWSSAPVNFEAHDFLSSIAVSATTNSPSKFFRVREIDIQGPTISFVSPKKDAISIPADSTISMRFDDDAGIDTNSISITVDGIEVDVNTLSWDGENLVFTPPSGALGTNGQVIVVSVTAADSLGNETTEISSLALSQELKVVANSVLYVGDMNLGTATFSLKDGTTTDKASINLVGMDAETMTFFGASASDFNVGQFILSLVPTNIFYRKVLAVTVDPDGTCHVATTNSRPSEIISGNFSLDCISCPVYDENGNLIELSNGKKSNNSRRVLSTHVIEPTGTNIDRYIPLGTSFQHLFKHDEDNFGYSLDGDASFRILGRFAISGIFDPLNESNNDLDLFFQGQVLCNLDIGVSVSGTITKYENTKTLPVSKIIIPIMAGIWFEWDVDIDLALAINADMLGSVSAGGEVGCGFWFHRRQTGGVWYKCPDDLRPNWYAIGHKPNLEVCGNVSVRVEARVKLSCLFESMLGPFIQGGPFIKGSIERSVTSSGTTSFAKKVIAGGFVETGIDSRFIKIKSLGSNTLRTEIYKILYSDEDAESLQDPVSITKMPDRLEVDSGDSVMFDPVVTGSGILSYTWAKNGIPIGKNTRQLEFSANEKNAGTYTLSVHSNSGSQASKSTQLVVTKNYDPFFIGTWELVDREYKLVVPSQSPNHIGSESCRRFHIFPNHTYHSQSRNRRVQSRYGSVVNVISDTGWYSTGSGTWHVTLLNGDTPDLRFSPAVQGVFGGFVTTHKKNRDRLGVHTLEKISDRP